MIDRRLFVSGAAAAGLLPASQAMAHDPVLSIRDLEKSAGVRLGVAMRDTGGGSRFDHRANELFPLASTFKLLAAAAVLAKVDSGDEALDRRVPVSASDLVAYSPTVEKRVGGDISIAELCEAAITLSDNAAGNLLLSRIGGPEGLTRYMRSIGDETTRLDRIEPGLNEAKPGDPRDTTSPAAMAADMAKLLVGEALKPSSREQLTKWLIANKTGDRRIRAGAPKGWRVGDKTGTGERGTTNDVAILWPPGRKPILLAIYLTQSNRSMAEREEIIAEVTRNLTSHAH
ncbi:MAG: class A beta-lactamase [Rhodoblastus sp.]